jgi:hypothetical protein
MMVEDNGTVIADLYSACEGVKHRWVATHEDAAFWLASRVALRGILFLLLLFLSFFGGGLRAIAFANIVCLERHEVGL